MALVFVEGGQGYGYDLQRVIGITGRKSPLVPTEEDVNIIPPLGGGFGPAVVTDAQCMCRRRYCPAAGKPVAFFDRKEEFQNDTFRPTHHVRSPSSDELPDLPWQHHCHLSSGDVMFGSPLFRHRRTHSGRRCGAHGGEDDPVREDPECLLFPAGSFPCYQLVAELSLAGNTFRH